jgi:hypothetical protein
MDPRDSDRESPEPDAPPSAEEVAAAEALRDALGSAAPNDAADFARAVSLAHAPRALDADEHRAIVERAIAARGGRKTGRARLRTRATLVAGVGASLALAATIALFVGRAQPESASLRAAIASEPLVPVRSTQALFREPFARSGGESARIDRIALARAADLRANRFAAWGVK